MFPKVFADSPAVLTTFWKEYLRAHPDHKLENIINSVRYVSYLGEGALELLTESKIPLAAKLVLINASINHQGAHAEPRYASLSNSVRFREYLEKKYDIVIEPVTPLHDGGPLVDELIYGRPKFLFSSKLTGAELASLGYLLAIDRPYNPIEAINVLIEATRKEPDSKAIRLILGLTIASLVDIHIKLTEVTFGGARHISVDTRMSAFRAISTNLTHLPQNVLKSYIYLLFIPFREITSAFKDDFPPEALSPILALMDKLEPDYRRWKQAQTQFFWLAKPSESQCEAFLSHQNVWTDPLNLNL